MPSIVNVVRRFTKQNMLYWQKTGSDQFGKPVYALPVTLPVRWEDKQQEVILPDGRKVWSRAYLLLTTPTTVGSLVFLGGGVNPMADWQAQPTYPQLPTTLQGSREVILLQSTPDLKAEGQVYEAHL
jgi:hypothetical protein